MRIVAAILLSTLLCLGQTDLATVRGVITDQTGAVVPKANVPPTPEAGPDPAMGAGAGR